MTIKSNINLALILFCASLISCGIRTNTSLTDTAYPALSSSDEVYVFAPDETPPVTGALLGQLEIKGNSFSTKNCDFNEVISFAQSKARTKGANVIKINKIANPNIRSTCYRLECTLYSVGPDQTASIAAAKSQAPKPKANAETAVIHFYRPKNYSGSAIRFPIQVEDGEYLGKLKSGRSIQYVTSEFGITNFNSRSEVFTIDVQPGKEYYVACNAITGFPLVKAGFQLREENVGQYELERTTASVQ